MATILSNGSKFAGEKPDTVGRLLDVLETHTLNPVFERYGNFFHRLPSGEFQAFGNFADVSHVFDIRGTLEELRPLALAIKRNRRSSRYLLLKQRGWLDVPLSHGRTGRASI